MPAVLCQPVPRPRIPADEIELVDEHIHRSNGIVLSNPIFQPLWEIGRFVTATSPSMNRLIGGPMNALRRL